MDGTVYSTRFAFCPKPHQAVLDDLLMAEDLMHWCDFAFSDHLMPWEFYERTRRGIEGLTDERVLVMV